MRQRRAPNANGLAVSNTRLGVGGMPCGGEAFGRAGWLFGGGDGPQITVKSFTVRLAPGLRVANSTAAPAPLPSASKKSWPVAAL